MSRITIDKDYQLDYDGKCYTLIFNSVITGEGRGAHLVKKENIGKVREIECGYYAKLGQALGAYINRVPERASNLNELMEVIKSAEQTVMKVKA